MFFLIYFVRCPTISIAIWLCSIDWPLVTINHVIECALTQFTHWLTVTNSNLKMLRSHHPSQYRTQFFIFIYLFHSFFNSIRSISFVFESNRFVRIEMCGTQAKNKREKKKKNLKSSRTSVVVLRRSSMIRGPWYAWCPLHQYELQQQY